MRNMLLLSFFLWFVSPVCCPFSCLPFGGSHQNQDVALKIYTKHSFLPLRSSFQPVVALHVEFCVYEWSGVTGDNFCPRQQQKLFFFMFDKKY